MREETIKRFFLGEVDGDTLAKEASDSFVRIDESARQIVVEDMDGDFLLTRNHLALLCDLGIAGRISEDGLSAIGFSLVASDHLSWEGDDVIAEVLHDWSCPEVNYPLSSETLEMHKSWLLGSANPPDRPPLSSYLGRPTKLVSTCVKVSP